MVHQTVGLTLGKFAPLHRGHQHLIETALAEMDRVIVVIYDSPEITTIPLTVRANWIKILYPTVKVIEAWDGPAEIGYSTEVKRLQEHYITKLLNGQLITHFYSSEFYGEHMSQSLRAVNRMVDEERIEFPISGTAIRKDCLTYKEYIHPTVYKDLITKVVFLGAPSTGKTTITRRLAEEYKTVWMPEYGREYWERHQVEKRLSSGQLVEIAEGHIEAEDQTLQKANNYLFVDTNAITTYMFSIHYHGCAPSRLKELALLAASRYDLVFVCHDDIPYDNTLDRSGEVQRTVFQKQIISDLNIRKIPFILLTGTLNQRVMHAKSILIEFVQYTSLAECLINRHQGNKEEGFI